MLCHLQAGTRRTSPNDVSNIMGALFLCLVFMGFQNATGVLPIVGNARPVFYRERAANMYCIEAFALTNVRRTLFWLSALTLCADSQDFKIGCHTD